MAIISRINQKKFRGYGNTQFHYAMTYVVITFVVLLILNIYCSNVSQMVFYQSKEASMIEKCHIASDEISAAEVLNPSTVSSIVSQIESLKVTRMLVTDQQGLVLYDSQQTALGQYALLPEILQALGKNGQGSEGNDVFSWKYRSGVMDSHAATPITYYGSIIGCVYMTDHDTAQGALIHSLQLTVFQITLVLEIIVLLFSLAFASAFSRRVRKIMASIRIIQEGDYTHKVTMGGNDRLEEKLAIRPTSETLFCDHFARVLQSHRDLPMKYNQWCSVLRWEKTSRPFLRHREFLWQEGHTAHATAEESQERTLQMLNVYAKFLEEVLAIPAIKGQKTEKEKFAGAIATYTVEALMHDGKALQSGTSHNFGDGFAKAFGIQFADKDNTLKYVHQTSWGMTTRLIGALIMVHGDNEGLVIPPRVAPIQICIVPVMQKKEGVLDKAYELRDRLAKDFRVKVDDSDKTPGFKFAEAEMRGYPIRVEIGPKDIEAGKCVICRRDTREKTEVALEDLETKAAEILETMQKEMLERARAHRDSHTYVAHNMEEFEQIFNEKSGFVKAMWCGCQECEDKIKEKLAVTSRCMPFEQEQIADTCVCCGKPAKKMVYWGRAY